MEQFQEVPQAVIADAKKPQSMSRLIWISFAVSLTLLVTGSVGITSRASQSDLTSLGNLPSSRNARSNVLVLARSYEYNSLGFHQAEKDRKHYKETNREIVIIPDGRGDDGSRSRLASFPVVWDQNAIVTVELNFRIEILASTDPILNEKDPLVCQALLRIDDIFVGQAPYDFVGQLVVVPSNVSLPKDSGWRKFRSANIEMKQGEHLLTLGGYCSRGTTTARVSFDRVTLRMSEKASVKNLLVGAATSFTSRSLSASLAVDTLNPKAHVHTVINRLRLKAFKNNIRILSNFGDRTQGSNSYLQAAAWVEQTLTGFGYVVERARYTYYGNARNSMYVTKVGNTFPDRMYIVSAHLDGTGGGGAANDNGSGCSLLLEMARLLASNDVSTELSIRLVFWNNEETGLDGSYAYAQQREALQGQESPPGSGLYPEPTWLGIIQHDQILFDHGLPVQVDQIPGANLNIEYLGTSVFHKQSLALSNALVKGNAEYAKWYPAVIGNNMAATDSISFADLAASVSVRENERIAGIGQGSQPNWHKPTDLYETYSDKDYLFGLNCVQTTLGTVAELAGLRVNLVMACLKKLRAACHCSTIGDCYATTLANKCLHPIDNTQDKWFQRRIKKRYTRFCSRRSAR
jgi:hypothetical protein